MPRGMSQHPQCQLSSLSRLLERANFLAALWRWQRGCNCWLSIRARPSTTFTLLSLQSEEKWECFEPFGNGRTEGCETDTVERKGYCTSVFREESALKKKTFSGVLKQKAWERAAQGPRSIVSVEMKRPAGEWVFFWGSHGPGKPGNFREFQKCDWPGKHLDV